MLNNEDIIKLSQVLATKEDISKINDEIDKLQESMLNLINSVDALAKSLG